MKSQVWGLWDCQELLSVHLSQTDAHDALEEHLAGCRCFADDQELISAAVEIRCMSVLDDRASVENHKRFPVPVQDGAQTCHDPAIRGAPGGGSCADR